MDLKFYLSIFWRRFPYFLILLTLGTAIGVAVALILPPVYVAEARLVVESEQIPDDLARTTVRTDASEQLQIIRQRILTRDNLLEMANRLGIYRGAGAPDSPMTPDETVADLRQRVRIITQAGSVVRGRTTATIVRVNFSAPTAAMAATVTNEVVTLILDENVDMRTTVSGQTLDFFTQEVARLELELAQLSGEILQFKEANQESLPDSLDFRRSQQAAAQERLLEQERAENILRDRRDRLVVLYEQTGDDGLFEEQDSQTAEAAQLKALQDQLATSVAVLSLDNPRVAVLRAQIAALETIVAEQEAQAADLTEVNEAGDKLSPYELQLADLDGQLAFIAEQKARLNETLDALAVTIAATPGNALTLETLDRNYENLRTQYDQAVANRARAEQGDTIEALSRGQRITVIEQARAPNQPSSPNRARIGAMGVAGGLAMGLGIIVLLELLNAAVRRPADIVKGLDITPLVTLPYMRTRGQIWRRRLIILTVFMLVLIGLPAAIWYVDTNIRPLQPILDAVLRRAGLS